MFQIRGTFPNRLVVWDVCPLIILGMYVSGNVCICPCVSSIKMVQCVSCRDTLGPQIGVPTEVLPKRSFVHKKKDVSHLKGSSS